MAGGEAEQQTVQIQLRNGGEDVRTQFGVVVVFLLITAVFAMLNPDLLAQDMSFNLFGWAYKGPFVVFLLEVVATWLILLLAGWPADIKWRRKAASLEKDLAAAGQEIVALKAAAFDRQREAQSQPPAGAGPSTTAGG